MTKPKQLIFLLLLFIVVGIAAVSTNVIISGSTQLASNSDDFNVYFSNVLVNGAQDLSLVRSETSLVFTGEFSAVGDKKEITYDVTNASKNYDADIAISCTQSTTYLTITNSFDTSTNLVATSTRTGVLSITLSKSYTGADLTQDISCTISASAVERTSSGSGEVSSPLNPYYIGREIVIGNEKFNIISTTEESVTMLAQYNINYDVNAQSVDSYYYMFSDPTGWNNISSSKDIDIQNFDGETKEVVNNYVYYLRNITNDSTITGGLITLSELLELGCTIQEDYTWSDNESCLGSEHISWLSNGQHWWIGSLNPSGFEEVWGMSDKGTLFATNYAIEVLCVRPVVTVSKETLQYISSFREYKIGQELVINDEIFFVIADDISEITVITQYNISNDTFRQKSEQEQTGFGDENGWDYIPDTNEIDVKEWGGSSAIILNRYMDYMKTELGTSFISGDFISLNTLKKLGCTYDISSDEGICVDSVYSSWLINNQSWWTCSAYGDVLIVSDTGELVISSVYGGSTGVRPIITISKSFFT